MLNLSSIMLGSMQQKQLVEFYEKIFEKKPDWSDSDWSGWQAGNTHITIGKHSEAKGKAKDPARIVFNFETKEVKEEFERIKKVEGVKVIKEPYEMQGMWIATLADPDGNYFQLMTPWESK